MRGGFRAGSGRKRVLTDHQVRRLIRLREESRLPFKDIGPMFGLSEDGARIYYRRIKPVTDRRFKKFTDADVAKMKKLRQQGLEWTVIAKRFGITDDAARRLVQRRG